MKIHNRFLIGLVALLAGISIQAQTNPPLTTTTPPTPAQPPHTEGQAIDFAYGTRMTNVTAITYFEWKPSSGNSPAQQGGGIGITYDAVDTSIVNFKPGIFIDYLGSINIASANVGIDHTFTPFANSTSLYWKNWTVTTGGYSGLGMTWGAANTTTSTVEVGAYIDCSVYGKWHGFFGWGNRSNSGSNADGNNFKLGITRNLGGIGK